MKSNEVPRHIGIIMDGNGRWATKRLLPRNAGHLAGVKNIVPIVSAAIDYGVECVTLYAFSTENKGRDKAEVDGLIDLIRKRLQPMTDDLISRGSKVMFSGDSDYFPPDVRKLLGDITQNAPKTAKSVVNIALDYGGREEIIRAANNAVKDGKIAKEDFEANLYTANLPELDMIVRTGGEKRLSNFLLYQAAYAELFFTETLWPDFTQKELLGMIDDFSKRTRKFGKI